MRDISSKIVTERTAHASAVLKMKPASIEAIESNTTPKKDVLATARAAGYLGVKNTSMAIPHCHPIPVEAVNIDFEISADEILIKVIVKTIYKTGCEMEALHGASIAALTIYDMLKPVDKSIEISAVKLDKKTGGKSDYADKYPAGLKASVIVISDSISAGKKHDKAGKAIIEKLEGINVSIDDYIIVPDEPDEIRGKVEEYCEKGVGLVITTGGTGLSDRDSTPEALKPVIEREVQGIMEAARSYGQERTPYSMLSRSIAGVKGKTLILALPGSTKGASESMDALFPHVLHIFKVLNGGRHD